MIRGVKAIYEILAQVFTLDIMNEQFLKVAQSSRWKEETQRYNNNRIPRLMELKDAILSGKYRPSPTRGFITVERGKARYIANDVIDDKMDNPINPGNKKLIIFSAFADTATYLYKNLSLQLKQLYNLE